MDLRQFLKENKFDIEPILDGTIQRFQRGGSSLSGWFYGKTLEIGGKTVVFAIVADYRTGERHEFQGGLGELTDEERNQWEGELLQGRAMENMERQKEADHTAAHCQKLFAGALVAGRTPYMQRKKLPHLGPARINPNRPSELWVPIYDLLTGEMRSIQRIEADGGKYMWPGGQKAGCGCILGEVPTTDYKGVIYVAEGYSTAASIFLAQGTPVCMAVDAGNLERVGSNLRLKFPEARLVFCADDDRWPSGDTPRTSNPGVEAAERASETSEGRVVIPRFTEGSLKSKPTDFNDLHCLEGIERVQEQLNEDSGSGDKKEKAGPKEEPKKEKRVAKKGVSEVNLASAILANHNGNLMSDGKQIFEFNGRCWKELRHGGINRLKIEISHHMRNAEDSRKVESAFKTLLRYIPAIDLVPVGVGEPQKSFFQPNPFCANFLNGTLYINQSKEFTYSTQFTPGHRKTDFLTSVLPYEYDPSRSATNSMLLSTLDRVFQGDTDKEAKIRAVRQMYGACLVGAFPRLFMLWGPPKTGKTTIIQIAEGLVSHENRCSVQPHALYSFHMSSMPGKLLNSDDDICTTRPMVDDVIKKIENRRAVRVERKHDGDVMSFLPGIHVFGANEVPKTMAGDAHARRWTFIEFKNVQGGVGHNKEYWREVIEHSPMGVLNFALEGLEDLCRDRGHYTNPESGTKKIGEWANAGDLVAQFILAIDADEVLDGNTKLIRGNGEVSRSRVWGVFCAWLTLFAPQKRHDITQHEFYDSLGRKGLPWKRGKPTRVIDGLILSENGSAVI